MFSKQCLTYSSCQRRPKFFSSVRLLATLAPDTKLLTTQCTSHPPTSTHTPNFSSSTEFVLNHLHSSHKHRRFNGDTLDMTMVVPSVDVDHMSSLGNMKKAGSTSNLSEKNLPPGPSTTQTWPFVEVYCNKRYFYLEAQSYIIDGHPELFLWLWFLG